MRDPTSPAALITGGTSGIGQATARLLPERGYQVIVTGQNPATIAAARAAAPASPPRQFHDRVYFGVTGDP